MIISQNAALRYSKLSFIIVSPYTHNQNKNQKKNNFYRFDTSKKHINSHELSYIYYTSRSIYGWKLRSDLYLLRFIIFFKRFFSLAFNSRFCIWISFFKQYERDTMKRVYSSHKSYTWSYVLNSDNDIVRTECKVYSSYICSITIKA